MKRRNRRLRRSKRASGTAPWPTGEKRWSLYEQLWQFPDEKKRKEGHKEIEQASKLHPRSQREQGFLTVAAAFYQQNSKLTPRERSKAYSAALEKFYEQRQDDVEVGAFYALSLVALAEQEESLHPLLEKYPDHPGDGALLDPRG